MKQSRKNFIKKAHENACSDWKTKIEKEFPELFKEDALVVGKWYKFGGDYLICIKKIKGTLGVAYGFKNNSWFESTGFQLIGGIYQHILATDKEVEQALIKEAKKRGFKEGCVIKHNKEAYPSLEGNEIIRNDNFYFNIIENFITIYGWEIFTDGKWATIVETITKEQAEKELGKTILN